MAFELHRGGRDRHGNARLFIGDFGQIQIFENGIILPQQQGALPRGQNAGLTEIVLRLPGCHGRTGAAAKGPIDGTGIDASPLHGDLQLFAGIFGQSGFAGAGLAWCFIHDFRLRFRLGLRCGLFGCWGLLQRSGRRNGTPA